MASTDLYQVAVAFATSRAWAAHWVPNLMSLVHSVSQVPGDIIECGSYRGGTAMALALADSNKQVYAFDTFSGMPQVSAADQHKQGDFGDINFDEVLAATKPFANLSLVKGDFASTFSQFLGSRPSGYTISALFLDCDLYDSYKLALETFWHRVSPGGICILEDYGVTDCQGATKAIEEFFPPIQIELKERLYVVTK